MIKVITIDFWNTLFDSSNGVKRNAARQHVLFEEISKYGVNVTNEEYDKALKASWEFFNNIWMNEQRTPQTEETITFFWEYLKLPHNQYSIERVAKIFKDSILDYPPVLMEGVKEFLQKYQDNFKFGLISDTGFTPGSILVELMEMNGVAKYFQSYSFSDETGASKPNKKAYYKILDDFNVLPEEAIHIGDIEKTDIIGAKSLGMKAIRYDGDKTSNFMKNNTPSTIADYQCHSWLEIDEIISGLIISE